MLRMPYAERRAWLMELWRGTEEQRGEAADFLAYGGLDDEYLYDENDNYIGEPDKLPTEAEGAHKGQT